MKTLWMISGEAIPVPSAYRRWGTSHDDPRESWEPLRTETSLRRGDQNGPWLKPFLEKPAEAGSAHHLARIPGPKGPVDYASHQAAEASSLIGYLQETLYLI